ncbi:probable inorganic phosphate transporter 1-10 [Telopea speciosissima]|uniref:probable inorganic phosphate transporter 1-10 n=1 Tax=Telopea speciosissima TaxID=54955 RepID=UPI001CC74A1A|nr:probable inorganic phosphate transporter 1-10 [Telopea speciosissima]
MGLKVLSALDTAKTQYYHFKAIIIAGMGLFTDAYDLFCIAPVMKLIGHIYYSRPGTANSGVTPPSVVSIMVSIALLGTVIGKLVFGRLGDLVGRRRVYGLALILMVSSSVGCGFSICRTKKCVLTSLCFFRFWLGVGIGGDYPLSATIMSEFANKRTRGSFIAAVFCMQGFGILTSSAVTMAVCAIFNRVSGWPDPKRPTPDEADLAWRLILMIGAIPAAMTYYWRMMMPETARYTALVEQNICQAVKDMEKVLDVPVNEIKEDNDLVLPDPPSYGLFSKIFFQRHGRDLFACAITWFLIDVVFYCNNLFQSQIYSHSLPEKKTVNSYQEAFHVAKLQAIIAICSTIPGYWATVALIDRVGRVKIQMMGFFCVSLCLFAVGISYDKYWKTDPNAGFLILYGLIFFFSNFGPNTTTFIIPAELFPARFRSTCHGISGAAGKVGAIIGSVGFLWASQEKHKRDVEYGYHEGIGMMKTLMLLGVIGLVGMILTFFFTRETMGRSLEENEREEGSDHDGTLWRSLTNYTKQYSHTTPSAIAAAT